MPDPRAARGSGDPRRRHEQVAAPGPAIIHFRKVSLENEKPCSAASFSAAKVGPFFYGRTAQRLLHVPLDPAIPNLSRTHQRFVAGRSMRDVEPNAALKLRDPYNNPIAGAEDAV